MFPGLLSGARSLGCRKSCAFVSWAPQPEKMGLQEKLGSTRTAGVCFCIDRAQHFGGPLTFVCLQWKCQAGPYSPQKKKHHSEFLTA